MEILSSDKFDHDWKILDLHSELEKREKVSIRDVESAIQQLIDEDRVLLRSGGVVKLR